MAVELQARWGRHNLPFTLQRSDGNRLSIVVQPDGRIEVTAPRMADEEAIRARVSRRGSWIVRQRDDFERFRPRTPTRQYVSGETHLLHGRQLRLKVLRDGPEEVSVDAGWLYVATPSWMSRDAVKSLLDAWYSKQARIYLNERFDLQSPVWARHGVLTQGLIVRRMLARWGSMTPAGRLVLNSDLVRASAHLVDYVIAHEMAHRLYPHHGQEWQRLLSEVMPDWRKRKQRLESELA